ncbi:abscission/NoCut checkpoint regulator [Sabethes cyaneus]|uniref:abscission/NoCut checkpoint regulator n=1 Tax=Sabethes cyaneus TaxID=53552 RepID=UPI00237D9928|nr:abscission/NoCut checkpoint regulator [Sabethes cyaneus]
MACNGCTKQFGLLMKEHGCPVCKFSFCKKCLRFSIKQDGKNKNVCLRCYDSYNTGKRPNQNLEKQKTDLSILDKPMESTGRDVILEPTQNPSVSMNSVLNADSQIMQRLAALKQEDIDNDTSKESSLSYSDIEKRLAALKGMEYKDYTESNKKLLARDNRTQGEQIEDLMKQFTKEQQIHDAISDYQLAGIEEIEKRLAVLKGSTENNTAKDTPSVELQSYDEENEDEIASKLTAQFLEEAAIDAKNAPKDNQDELNNIDIPTLVDPSELEELPWCTICNEDAKVRCVSCDGDLFCDGCFRECHEDDEEYRVHITKSYKAVPKANN